jgi:uncharacterized protein (DUF1800 family)
VRARAVLCLLVLCLLALAGPLAGCDPSLATREEYVLNRIGYGPDAWSRQRIRQLGIRGYIEEQLRPEQIDDSATERRVTRLYPSLSLSVAASVQRYPSGSTPGPGQPRVELARAKVLRAVYSRRQLEQVLVDFWFDHFNVDARNEIALWAVTSYERDAIRPHVLGRFEDLVRATASHPAMLEYLDNAQNFRTGFLRDGRPQGPNENFARELLELHTVGASGGYTLADVRDVARVFTGWTTRADRTAFTFLAAGHDPGAKRVLGLEIPAGGGSADATLLIRHLARHPRTAFHVATRLCERFVADRPPQECILAAASSFWTTRGNLREVMRTILLSDAFLQGFGHRTKVKRPLHWAASVGRALAVSDDALFAQVAVSQLSLMGEDLYSAPAPFGWPEDSATWIGEGPLVVRWNLAEKWFRGYQSSAAPGPLNATHPAALVQALQARLLPGGMGKRERNAAIEFARSLPEKSRAREVSVLLLSSPSFTLH